MAGLCVVYIIVFPGIETTKRFLGGGLQVTAPPASNCPVVFPFNVIEWTKL